MAVEVLDAQDKVVHRSTQKTAPWNRGKEASSFGKKYHGVAAA